MDTTKLKINQKYTELVLRTSPEEAAEWLRNAREQALIEILIGQGISTDLHEASVLQKLDMHLQVLKDMAARPTTLP